MPLVLQQALLGVLLKGNQILIRSLVYLVVTEPAAVIFFAALVAKQGTKSFANDATQNCNDIYAAFRNALSQSLVHHQIKL